ncbi:MAG: hypothetical protein N3A63_03285 [Bacteroidetes bacterium]|nr:hypothetical protein [Bacteroidota bacterium]
MSFTSPQKRTLLSMFLLLVVLTVLVIQNPLFSTVDSDFSYVLALPLYGVSGIVMFTYFRNKTFTTLEELRSQTINGIGTVLLLPLVPLSVALVHGIVIQTCVDLYAIALYFLVVTPAVLLGAALALISVLIFTRFQKLLFGVSSCFILCSAIIPLITSPQGYVYNLIFGYIPLLRFDEAVRITTHLVVYRSLTIAIALFLIALALWVWNRKHTHQLLSTASITRKSVLEIFSMAFLGPFVGVLFLFSERIGFSSSTETVKEKLGGHYTTDHFDIVYALGKIPRERIVYIGKLQEHYYNEICNSLEVKPVSRVTTFIYATEDQKARLVGASTLNFSKPWLRQIHINERDIEYSLKHELVHVLAGDFGWSPLNIARSAGALEGLAVAIGDLTWFGEPIDRAAAFILAVDTSVSLEEAFCWSKIFLWIPTRYYPVVGSFTKFLISQYGVETFKQFYRTNDFEKVYKQPLTTIAGQWKQVLSRYQFTSSDSAKARYVVFQSLSLPRKCTRALARIHTEAREYIRLREYVHAQASIDRSLAIVPTTEGIQLKVIALLGRKLFDDVLSTATAALGTYGDGVLPLRLRRGDAYWALDSVLQAQREYEIIRATHLSNAYTEAAAIRLEALDRKDEQQEWRIQILYDLDDTTRLVRLSHLTSGLAEYMRGKLALAHRQYRRAGDAFARAENLRSPVLRFYRYYYWAQALQYDFQFDSAAALYARALRVAPTDGLREETKFHLQRCTHWNTIEQNQ